MKSTWFKILSYFKCTTIKGMHLAGNPSVPSFLLYASFPATSKVYHNIYKIAIIYINYQFTNNKYFDKIIYIMKRGIKWKK